MKMWNGIAAFVLCSSLLFTACVGPSKLIAPAYKDKLFFDKKMVVMPFDAESITYPDNPNAQESFEKIKSTFSEDFNDTLNRTMIRTACSYAGRANIVPTDSLSLRIAEIIQELKNQQNVTTVQQVIDGKEERYSVPTKEFLQRCAPGATLVCMLQSVRFGFIKPNANGGPDNLERTNISSRFVCYDYETNSIVTAGTANTVEHSFSGVTFNEFKIFFWKALEMALANSPFKTETRDRTHIAIIAQYDPHPGLKLGGHTVKVEVGSSAYDTAVVYCPQGGVDKKAALALIAPLIDTTMARFYLLSQARIDIETSRYGALKRTFTMFETGSLLDDLNGMITIEGYMAGNKPILSGVFNRSIANSEVVSTLINGCVPTSAPSTSDGQPRFYIPILLHTWAMDLSNAPRIRRMFYLKDPR